MIRITMMMILKINKWGWKRKIVNEKERDRGGRWKRKKRERGNV